LSGNKCLVFVFAPVCLRRQNLKKIWKRKNFESPAKMPRIKIASLRAGMVVANDVKNIDDMLLIPAGCVLSERQINILQAWGVAEIEVQNSEAIAEANPLKRLTPERAEKEAAEIKSRFWSADESNPVHMEIFNLILNRRAAKILGG